MTLKKKEHPVVGICALTGGLSSRMGKDKTGLRLGTRTMLGQIRATVKGLGLPMRIIRRDLLPGCGPLGGIYTALKTSRSDAELFLACDMPFVSEALISRLLNRFRRRPESLFVHGDKGTGFPFILPKSSLATVERQIGKQQFSLQALARTLGARSIRLLPQQTRELFNINTPEQLNEARRRWTARG